MNDQLGVLHSWRAAAHHMHGAVARVRQQDRQDSLPNQACCTCQQRHPSVSWCGVCTCHVYVNLDVNMDVPESTGEDHMLLNR